MQSPKIWYAKTKDRLQGLIIDENTGANIAVSYNVDDADLIACAPELLFALKNLLEDVEYAQPKIKPGLIGNIQIRKAREIVDRLESLD
jgi:hypothetical protein